MPIKQISLKSLNPIYVVAQSALDVVNELRKQYGKNGKQKLPISLEKLIATTKILEQRNEDYGHVFFSVENDSGFRNFPNFGLEIISMSTITLIETDIAIQIDLTVRAGKPKWQINEINECADIFKNKYSRITLEYACDEKTDWSGHSVGLKILNEKVDLAGRTSLPTSFLEINYS